MKAKNKLKIALAAVTCACALSVGGVFASPSTAALAADSSATETVYPQDFDRPLTFDSPISDFAVYGDTFSFACNTAICITENVDGERKRTDYTHGSEISHLDYDAEGNLYFSNVAGNVYRYSSEPVQIDSYEFKDQATSYLEIGEQTFYTLDNDGVLEYWCAGAHTRVGDGFSLIKNYSGVVYAVKDNTLCEISESTFKVKKLSYVDFSGADNISVGSAKDALKSSDYQVETAIIKGGVYYTQIDPDKVEDKFVQLATRKTDGEKPCLVLYRCENAAIVTTNNGVFITANESLKPSTSTPPANDWPQNAQGRRLAYAVEDVGVYASPYMCSATRIGTLKSGAEHYVNVIEKFALDYLDVTFYKVSYNDGEQLVEGYVAANFLTNYNFAVDDRLPQEKGDEVFKYDTNVTSVVLVVLIVGLVIIAVMYITLASAKKGDKKRKKKKKIIGHSDSDD